MASFIARPHIALQKNRRSVDSGALQGSFRVWVGHLLLSVLNKLEFDAEQKITIINRHKIKGRAN
jgi:hypothetical protein